MTAALENLAGAAQSVKLHFLAVLTDGLSSGGVSICKGLIKCILRQFMVNCVN